MGTTYLTQSSNKRSLALDLKTPEGREVLKRLVPTADVLVENYRPGAMNALGLGYGELATLNPRLIYCSMSAFGHSGPRSSHTAYDPVDPGGGGADGDERHAGIEPAQDWRRRSRLLDRIDRRIRHCERLVPARAHRSRTAHRSGDVRHRADAGPATSHGPSA